MAAKSEVNHAWELVSERLSGWYEIGIKNFPNFVAALVIVVLFALAARWIARVISALVGKNVGNRAIVSLMSTLIRVIVVLTGVFIALGILNLDKTVTSLLAGAGVIGLALGFAFQDIAANFVSGILIAFRQPYRLDDIVEVEGFTGTVKRIDLRTTLLETFQGVEVYVPNQSMLTKPLQNISGTPRRRLDVEVGVSYGDDLRTVTDIITKSLETVTGRISDREVEVFFKEFGGSSINCDVRVWVHYKSHNTYLAARHDIIIRIKEAFDEQGITIPFPIRTLDFGIKGGERLTKPLSEALHPKNAEV